MRMGGFSCALALAIVFALATGGAASAAGPRSIQLPPEQVLYNFCQQSSCIDGKWPYAGLMMDGAGNLYGTTAEGGISSAGTVFRLAPGDAGWSETVLCHFCAQ